jgi:hypothetical protein
MLRSVPTGRGHGSNGAARARVQEWVARLSLALSKLELMHTSASSLPRHDTVEQPAGVRRWSQLGSIPRRRFVPISSFPLRAHPAQSDARADPCCASHSPSNVVLQLGLLPVPVRHRHSRGHPEMVSSRLPFLNRSSLQPALTSRMLTRTACNPQRKGHAPDTISAYGQLHPGRMRRTAGSLRYVSSSCPPSACLNLHVPVFLPLQDPSGPSPRSPLPSTSSPHSPPPSQPTSPTQTSLLFRTSARSASPPLSSIRTDWGFPLCFGPS